MRGCVPAILLLVILSGCHEPPSRVHEPECPSDARCSEENCAALVDCRVVLRSQVDESVCRARGLQPSSELESGTREARITACRSACEYQCAGGLAECFGAQAEQCAGEFDEREQALEACTDPAIDAMPLSCLHECRTERSDCEGGCPDDGWDNCFGCAEGCARDYYHCVVECRPG